MNDRENTLKSLNHERPDYIPVDLGATAVTGIHVYVVAALRDHFGLEKRPVKVHEPYQMLGLVEPDLQQALGVTVEGVFPPESMFGFRNENWQPFTMPNGLVVWVSEHFKISRDKKGDYLIHPKGDLSAPASGRMPKNGFFFDAIIRQPPVEDEKLDPRDNLEEFAILSDENLAYFKQEAEKAFDTDRFVIANFGGTALGDIALVPAPFLKEPRGIRDVEEWYVSTVTRQDYLHKVFEKQTAIAVENLVRIHERVGDKIHAVFLCGTDFGTQSSTFCSEKTFRELYFPYYKIMNDWIHRYTSWKTFKHSCGAVRSLIPAFIECGFDILNPVQLSAANMDALELKKEFGKDIVFWGGGVDTQKTLALGTPDQVRIEVRERCEILGHDGGFVFNTVHNIQANTPIENVVAMIDTLNPR
jgi:hypothetical protein